MLPVPEIPVPGREPLFTGLQDMATLTLILALMLTIGSVFMTGVLASRYGINDESFFGTPESTRKN
jgi:hypothetical protein